jgi:hypothetical protein
MSTDGIGEQPKQDARVDDLAEIRVVIAKAKAGDVGVLPQLREILDRWPALAQHYGALARQAEAAWVSLAAGSNLYLRETMKRAADAQRAELTRPGALPIENLLVERVVACALQMNYFSEKEASALAAGGCYRQLHYQSKRIGQAQRMYHAAIGALLTYQKLIPVPPEATVPRDCLSAEAKSDPCTLTEASQSQSIPRVPPLCEENEPIVSPAEERERLRVALSS